MKSVRWFSLLIALVTVGPLLTACSPSDPNSPAPGGSNASSASSPKAAANVAPPYPGFVDKSDCETVGGWVMNGADAAANVKVELFIDDKLAETLPAQNLRPDLANKVGTGRYGFTFKIPAAYKDGKPHAIKIKVAGSVYEVPFFQRTSPSFECRAS